MPTPPINGSLMLELTREQAEALRSILRAGVANFPEGGLYSALFMEKVMAAARPLDEWLDAGDEGAATVFSLGMTREQAEALGSVLGVGFDNPPDGVWGKEMLSAIEAWRPARVWLEGTDWEGPESAGFHRDAAAALDAASKATTLDQINDAIAGLRRILTRRPGDEATISTINVLVKLRRALEASDKTSLGPAVKAPWDEPTR